MVKKATAKVAPVAVPELLKLDLGCGQNVAPGFEGVDIVAGEKVKYAVNLLKFPWPWADASVGEVHSSHFVEHIPGGPPVEWGGTGIRHHFFDELYRVLVPDGKATIIVPSATSVRAIQDFTHAWPPLAAESFLYWNAGWRKQNGLDHYPVKCDFDFTYGHSVHPSWVQRNEETRTFAVSWYWNAAMDLHVTMTRRPASPA